jgi:hypothetical protein
MTFCGLQDFISQKIEILKNFWFQTHNIYCHFVLHVGYNFVKECGQFATLA